MKQTIASLKRELSQAKERAQIAERAEIALLREREQTHREVRPILAYMSRQWPGDIGPELRRLKELCR